MEPGDVELGEWRNAAADESGPEEEGRTGEESKDTESMICEACLQTAETTELACGTRYCPDCLRQLVEYSMMDVSLFPPRCCRLAIDPDVACRALDSDEDRDRFRRMYAEASTTVIYCPKPTCATAICLEKDDNHHDKKDDGDDGKKTDDDETAASTRTCPGCGAAVCTRCRREAHPGKGCPKKLPAEDEAVLRLARRYKWQRCPRCRHLVELNRGCNHLTCVCGYELCFKCGGPWWSDGLRRQRHCRCVLWDVDNIVQPPRNDRAGDGNNQDRDRRGVLRASCCVEALGAGLAACVVYALFFCFAYALARIIILAVEMGS